MKVRSGVNKSALGRGAVSPLTGATGHGYAAIPADEHRSSAGGESDQKLIRVTVALEVHGNSVAPVITRFAAQHQTFVEEVAVANICSRREARLFEDAGGGGVGTRASSGRGQKLNVRIGKDILSRPELQASAFPKRHLGDFVRAVEANVVVKKEPRVISENFLHPARADVDILVRVIVRVRLKDEEGSTRIGPSEISVESQGVVGSPRAHLQVEPKLVA